MLKSNDVQNLSCCDFVRDFILIEFSERQHLGTQTSFLREQMNSRSHRRQMFRYTCLRDDHCLRTQHGSCRSLARVEELCCTIAQISLDCGTRIGLTQPTIMTVTTARMRR